MRRPLLQKENMNIRLVIAKHWPDGDFEEQCNEYADCGVDMNDFIEKYVKDNVHKPSQLKQVGFVVQDFEVPELDKKLIMELCSGKASDVWQRFHVDFEQDYFNNWVFVEKNNKWVLQ